MLVEVQQGGRGTILAVMAGFERSDLHFWLIAAFSSVGADIVEIILK